MRFQAWLASTSAIVAVGLMTGGAAAADQQAQAAVPVDQQVQAAAPADQLVQTDMTTFFPDAAAPFQVAQISTAYPQPNKAGTGVGIGLPVQSRFNTSGNTTLIQPNQSPSPLPVYGLFPAFGRTLNDYGIDFHGTVLDHFLGQATAGVQSETNNLGSASFALDFDLQKLIGLRGGTLHVIEAVFFAKSNFPHDLLEEGGSLDGYQGSPAPETNDLRELTYEQTLLNRKLDIEAGKTNAYRYFFIPNGLDPFTSESTTIYEDGDFVPLAHPVWGGIVNYHFTPKWYAQYGTFEDDYRRSVDNSYNFGADLASGAQFLGEVAYRSEFSNARYPANFETGIEWNTRHGPSNDKGGAGNYSSLLSVRDYVGGGVFYAQGGYTVWRGPNLAHVAPRNILLWGSFAASIDKPQPIDCDAFVGVNFTGFLPPRPRDVFGVQLHYQRLSQIEAEHETLLQNRIPINRDTGQQQRDGYAFETLDQIQVTRWAQISPYVEYFINPDEYYDPLQRRGRNGFEGGVLTIISIGRLLGTSQKAG